jgi:hypothetical protein
MFCLRLPLYALAVYHLRRLARDSCELLSFTMMPHLSSIPIENDMPKESTVTTTSFHVKALSLSEKEPDYATILPLSSQRASKQPTQPHSHLWVRVLGEVNKSKSARYRKSKRKNAIPLPVMNNPTSHTASLCISVIASILGNQTRWVLLVFSTLDGSRKQI